jgi:nucleoside-diphosphate-sugar epimerase
MIRVLVTGAEGFVGRELVLAMQNDGLSVLAAVRDGHKRLPSPAEPVCVGDLSDLPDWRKALIRVDAVVHLAARAHVITERARDPIAAFRAINVGPSLSLFKACQLAGVARFVFVSSIGVNGVMTHGRPFRIDDIPNPTEPYAISKWEAERGLRDLATSGTTELVIVRPSLIYGPGAKGNFLRLLRLLNSGWPLPFGALTAKRSILSLANLCDLLIRCTQQREAAGKVLLAADVEPIATRDLITTLAGLMNRRARLVSVPPRVLTILGQLSGFGAEVSRLTGSLEVDSSSSAQLLDWKMGANFQYDMKRMVEAFLGRYNVAY